LLRKVSNALSDELNTTILNFVLIEVSAGLRMELALCEGLVAAAFRGLSALACSKCGMCSDRKLWILESAGKLLVGQWITNLGDVYKDVSSLLGG
jgi:hypothetical protein